MDEPRAVASFVRQHGMEAPPAYGLPDVVSEVGEVATGAAESDDAPHALAR